MSKQRLTIEQINKLTYKDFVDMFKNVIENYSTAAVLLRNRNRIFHNVMDLYDATCNVLDHIETYHKEKILQNHPGLVSRFSELVNLSMEDKYRLTHMISEYELKFEFSFVICYKENKICDILKALEQRLANSRTVEIEVAIQELKQISKYRILALIKHEYA